MRNFTGKSLIFLTIRKVGMHRNEAKKNVRDDADVVGSGCVKRTGKPLKFSGGEFGRFTSFKNPATRGSKNMTMRREPVRQTAGFLSIAASRITRNEALFLAGELEKCSRKEFPWRFADRPSRSACVQCRPLFLSGTARAVRQIREAFPKRCPVGMRPMPPTIS
ncbi:hypothetical protein FF011L_36990 [Roseimaritima multifibrata]|uniref:Uncharacterized protein n=1 Tax=Roseimaritima multifibrata TaxID=1930274 RepID=A0A517MJ48_9BACT|nr:hypothetical protein FF011L_36990 [Roseimaritima multifibrata]